MLENEFAYTQWMVLDSVTNFVGGGVSVVTEFGVQLFQLSAVCSTSGKAVMYSELT